MQIVYVQVGILSFYLMLLNILWSASAQASLQNVRINDLCVLKAYRILT